MSRIANFIRRGVTQALTPAYPAIGRRSRRKVYDCFLFFNELDLLELRLRTIYDHVDKIVLAECELTSSGEPKPLYFQENRARYSAFSDKLIHVITPKPGPDDFKAGMLGKMSSEKYQRKYLLTGARNAADEDIILLSDLDEIPKPEIIDEVKGALCSGVSLVAFRQHWHVLFLNARVVESFNRDVIDDPRAWFGTMACTRQTLRDRFQDNLDAVWGQKWGRGPKLFYKADPGGWHLSYMGGLEKVMTKLKATALQDMSEEDALKLKQRRFLDTRFEFIPVDATFPKDIQENPSRYAKYFLDEAAYDEAIEPFVQTWAKAAA